MIAETEFIEVFKQIGIPDKCQEILYMALRNCYQANKLTELVETAEEELQSIQRQDGAPEAMSLYQEVMGTLEKNYKFQWQYFLTHLNQFLSCMEKQGKHLS